MHIAEYCYITSYLLAVCVSSPLLHSVFANLSNAPQWEFACGDTSAAKRDGMFHNSQPKTLSSLRENDSETTFIYLHMQMKLLSLIWLQFPIISRKKRLTVGSFSVYSLCFQMEGQKALESWGNVSLWLSSASSEGRQPAVSVNYSHLRGPSRASNCWNERVCLWRSARRW